MVRHRRAALAAAFAAGLMSSASVLAAEVNLRILETSDIHVHLLPYNYYSDKEDITVGLAAGATLIDQARAEAKNVLLVDNGDLIQGNPLGDYVANERGLKKGETHPVYKAMNLMGYDVGNIGNHEFNYGLDFLGNAIAGANFPYVSANVFVDDGDGNPANDKHAFTPYVILDRQVVDEDGEAHDIKIGVIGFVPPAIMQWDRSHLTGKVTTQDMVDVANRLVPQMRAEGADVVVAVPHSGFVVVDRQGMEENATYFLSQVEGIDAIMFGHAHAVFPSDAYKDFAGADVAKGTINGVPAVMPGFWGSHVGIVDLKLETDGKGGFKVVDGKGEVRSIYTTNEDKQKVAVVEPKKEIVDAVRQDHEETLAYVRQAVGQTSAPIHSYFALVKDDPSIQIVTNAQKWYVEKLLKGSEYDGLPILSAGAPFKAGGRGGPDYFTDVAAGEIAIKNAADLYLYPNTVRAVLLDGAQVKEWLEMSAGAFNQIDPNSTAEQELLNPDFRSYNFDVIDGVTYKIDVTQPAKYGMDGKVANPEASRIVDLSFDGKPIDPEQKFVVVTNNYRAGGGGKFPGLDGSNVIVEAPDENRTALINYIFDQKTINPSADANWSLAPINDKVNVTFVSAPKAATYLSQFPDITAAGDAADGFAKYRLSFK